MSMQNPIVKQKKREAKHKVVKLDDRIRTMKALKAEVENFQVHGSHEVDERSSVVKKQ